MIVGSMRVSKRTWYVKGGFANSNCWRWQPKGRGWCYYIIVDRWMA